MLALRPKQKRWFIFILIVLSAYTGYKLSNFQPRVPSTPPLDVREAEAIFKNASNYNKTIMNFNMADLKRADSSFRQLIGTDGVKTKYYNNMGSGIIAIMEVTPQVVNQSEARLRELPGLTGEKTITTPRKITEIGTDVNSHIDQNKMILSRLRERVKSQHLTTREIGELQNQIRNIQTTIDSLSSIQSIEKERSNSIIFATVNPIASPMKGGKFIQFRNLTFGVIGSLIGYTLLTVAAYFCFEVLSKLLNYIGIKSSNPSSRYGGYKYGHYGYGYGEKRKSKKKKIYVPREGSDTDEEEELPLEVTRKTKRKAT
jgi:hypothetical protein